MITHHLKHRTLFLGALSALIAGSVISLGSPSIVWAKNVIGVVDVFKTYKSTDLGKAIQKNLDHFQKSRTAALLKEKETLRSEQDKLRKQAHSLGKDELKAREQKLGKRIQVYRQHFQKVRNAIAKLNTVEIQTFLKALSLATVAVGKQSGYEIILSQHPIRIQNGPYPLPFKSLRLMYITLGSDATDSVIKYINAHFPPTQFRH